MKITHLKSNMYSITELKFDKRKSAEIELYFAEECASYLDSQEVVKCRNLVRNWLEIMSIKGLKAWFNARIIEDKIYRFVNRMCPNMPALSLHGTLVGDAKYYSFMAAWTVGMLVGHSLPSHELVGYRYAMSTPSNINCQADKYNEYLSFVYSFKSTVDQKDDFLKSLNFEEKADVLFFFDYLTEHYPDHNVFKDNELNIPKPHKIKGTA